MKLSPFPIRLYEIVNGSLPFYHHPPIREKNQRLSIRLFNNRKQEGNRLVSLAMAIKRKDHISTTIIKDY
jgi:hypothetical protein